MAGGKKKILKNVIPNDFTKYNLTLHCSGEFNR